MAGFFVVAIDSSVHAGAQPVLKVRLSLAGLIGAASALVCLAVMAAHGFQDAGLRLGSEIAWRFAAFAFFAAAVAGPLCRLMPLGICRSLNPLRRQMIWGFCASYGVFLASMVLPNSLGGVSHDDATLGMTLFAIFGGGAAAMMAFSASHHGLTLLGESARRAMLSVAASFFWLTYALTGLAHLSGPHRPDAFYGISLSLMVFALLLRFADRFVAKFRGTPSPSLQS